ncbi:RDD domain containing protein [Elusimicrobium minutum Pei191]|uniref:RDD domain containing protein n=1 Tax=Elusimicrobium minutum (strain Pei191) TaxID=445932 RepID=B2KBP8_ELUMP|nr:RDD family protein [Elusimicrobium minutum]ACC97735.1 RDD domain containing protein [Elusimicrobium minutum Pei191]
MAYSAFWRRLVAYIIDGIIIGLIDTIISFVLGFVAAITGSQALITIATLLSLIIGLAVFIAYFAYQESSEDQATIGKKAMGIKVVDMNGNRIPLKTAAIRSASKILSAAIIYIGFIMAAFTQQKQALHDIIAKTLVIDAK